MADVAAMDIIIGAKVDGAVAGLNTVQKELAQTSVAASKVDSTMTTASTTTKQYTAAFAGLDAQLKKTPPALAATEVGLVGVGTAAEVAGAEAGIASVFFEELAVTLSSTGIGFVIIAATSLLVKLGETLLGTSKAAEEAKKANEEFAKSLNDARAGALKTGVELQGFINIAKDSKKPLEERNEALKEANKIMGEHGEKLTLANVATKAITEQTNLFTEALINQAVAAKYADKIADLIIKQTDASREYGKALDESNKKTKEANDLNKISTTGTGGIGGGGNIVATRAAAAAYSNAVDKATDYKEVTSEINTLLGDLATAQDKATAAMAKLGHKTKETHIDLKALADDLWKIHLRTQELEQGATIADLFAFDPIKLQKSVVAVRTISQIQHDLLTQQTEEQKVAADNLAKAMIGPLEEADAFTKKSAERRKKDFEDIVQAAQALQGVFTNLFTQIAETGKISIQSLLKSMEQLIIKLLAAATAAFVLNLALGGGFYQIFEKLTGINGFFAGIGKTASGGIVTGPQIRLIGEAGPEAVIPIDRLREFMNVPGSATPIVLDTRISGNDLYLIQSRTQQRRNRTY